MSSCDSDTDFSTETVPTLFRETGLLSMIASRMSLIDNLPSAYFEIREFLRVVSFELGLSTSDYSESPTPERMEPQSVPLTRSLNHTTDLASAYSSHQGEEQALSLLLLSPDRRAV